MALDPTEPDFAYLTTSGRITGTPHRIEIWFARSGYTVYMLAGDRDRSDWVRNIMVSSDVVLKIGERERHTRARVIEAESDDDGIARSLLVEKYASRGHGDLSDWGTTALPVAVDWPD